MISSTTEVPVATTQAPAVQELRPRGKAFLEKSTDATNLIIQKVLTTVEEDKNLSARQFIAKNVTPAGQQEISSLTPRVQVLFKNVVLQSMTEIVKQKSAFIRLIMMSAQVGDLIAHGKFVKEAALPIVKELVVDLDTNFPGVIDEAIVKGVQYPELHKKLGLE